VVALVAALVGGAFWGGLVGFLKARTGAHEVITTIMFNYLAASILLFALSHDTFQRPGSDNALSRPVDDSATFPRVQLAGFDVHTGVVLALVAALAVWWLLDRSTWGFELRAVGANAQASRTAGMSVAKVYTLAMLFAGLLAGLAATMQVLGNQNSLSQTLPGSIGFDAITVALLGRATPLGTVLAGLLFGAMSVGGVAMQASAGTPKELTDVLQALIVLFVAAPALVKGLLRIKESGGGATVMAKGWGS
jgi:simple sugar transport system permease protein